MSLLSTPFDPAREAALVTGAGNGIGRAIAQALVGEGVRTVFADVSPERVSGGGQDLAAAGTGGGVGRRSRQRRRVRCAAGACAERARAGRRISCTAPRRRGARPITRSPSATKPGQQMHAVNLEAGFHLARELARTADRGESARLVPVPDLAARRARRATCRITRRRRRAWRCW